MKAKPVICPSCGSDNTTSCFYGKAEEYDEALKVMKKNPPLYGGDTTDVSLP